MIVYTYDENKMYKNEYKNIIEILHEADMLYITYIENDKILKKVLSNNRYIKVRIS